MRLFPRISLLLLAVGLIACTSATKTARVDKSRIASMTPYEAPKEPPGPQFDDDSAPVFIRNATLMTAAGKTIEKGHLLLEKGRIQAIGEGQGNPPSGAEIIDAAGRFVTPGLIDTHSHMGVYAIPSVPAHSDGNEMTSPTTAEVWAEHSFWPQDPSIWRAVSGGITTIQVLPGSANLIGGRSYVAKLKPAISARLMRFPGAPQGLKMACGENPKRVYGNRGSAPSTRMGNVAGYRAAFQRALEYRRTQQEYVRDLALWEKKQKDKSGDAETSKEKDEPDDPPSPPARNFALETLALVLDGKILVHNHCYRADEMSLMMDVANEFGFSIRSFHHALEAYKIRHRLAKEGVSSSTWSDWWGFKMEAFDGIPQNAALLSEAGARAIIHSDSEAEIRHLNQEAEKARTSGKKIGIQISDDEVLRWITANPAWALGIQDQVGTLEVGKMADVVIWDRKPFSVYARAMQVFIDGEIVYDREKGIRPVSDFEIGLFEAEAGK